MIDESTKTGREEPILSLIHDLSRPFKPLVTRSVNKLCLAITASLASPRVFVSEMRGMLGLYYVPYAYTTIRIPWNTRVYPVSPLNSETDRLLAMEFKHDSFK